MTSKSSPSDPYLPALIEPSFSWMVRRISRLIAFGFGSGLIRPAPGTWGTLLAWGLWPIVGSGTPGATAALLLLAFLVGVWACHRVGRELGRPDHGGMVWDEIVAFWCVLWLLPDTIYHEAFGFLLFRLFDIFKPPPIRYFDRRLKHGLGVMWDDIVAAFYTVLVFAIATRLFG